MKMRLRLVLPSSLGLLFVSASLAQTVVPQPLLTVKEIMNGMVTPTTATIWGAYQLETDAEWQEVRNAALSVIAAGNLLQLGGVGEGESALALESNWQEYNQQMIDAARKIVMATEDKNEEALSALGNDELYPPCESCHQQYQAR